MNMTKKEPSVRYARLLHDVGKIGIKDSIGKPGGSPTKSTS
jgi:HD-GYP domain-containing protein (c-di-GMP phosphodiesterase class II)